MLLNDESLELLELLGTGGFAQTYRARIIDSILIDEWNVEEVAVKIPHTKKTERSITKDIELIGSLHMQLKEVEAKNIVKYLGFCTYEGKIVMVTEYIRGGNLRNITGNIGSWKKVDFNKVINISLGILEGISTIHKKRIIHRDIKPENILMDGEIPKITDFGIGRILETNEQATTVTGTIIYMSPELLYGKASYNTDLWSFGVTFYEMLCRRFPFGIDPHDGYGTIIELIKDERRNITFPDEVTITPKLKKVLSKLLEKDPLKRYQTADEVIKDIRDLSSGADDNVEKELSLIQGLLSDPARVSETEEELKIILNKYPDSPCIYLHLGEFYNKCGDYNKATHIFRKGLEIKPDEAMLHWGLAMAYNRLEAYRDATNHLAKALSSGLERNLERYGKLLLKTFKKKSLS